MKVSARTLTAVAVATNPLVWVVVCCAVAYCVLYVMFLYVRQELSIPRNNLSFALPSFLRDEELPPRATPAVAEAECRSCGVTMPGQDCKVCGARDKTAPPSVLVQTTPAVVGMPLSLMGAADKASRAVTSAAARETQQKLAKTRKKSAEKSTKKPSKARTT